mmetsp:Transcript_58364/g.115837  ORF Transcript_58364/g.115837 Transcript_58364/m.115837 type:complete len:227 (-) Transcript_58364:1839-2519(-)
MLHHLRASAVVVGSPRACTQRARRVLCPSLLVGGIPIGLPHTRPTLCTHTAWRLRPRPARSRLFVAYTTYARYLYTLLLAESRSRYSRAIKSSMRFLICFGSGLKCRSSWLVASSTNFWWSSVLRVFMMRTIAASMACLRSSSTVALVESFSSWVILAAIIGTLMRRARSVKFGLYLNESVASTSLDAGSLSNTLYFPTQSDNAYLFSSSAGRLSCCWMSLNERLS